MVDWTLKPKYKPMLTKKMNTDEINEHLYKHFPEMKDFIDHRKRKRIRRRFEIITVTITIILIVIGWFLVIQWQG